LFHGAEVGDEVGGYLITLDVEVNTPEDYFRFLGKVEGKVFNQFLAEDSGVVVV